MTDDLMEIYERIGYLRGGGMKMKEIAAHAGLPPTVLSSLYTTVLPAYAELRATLPPDEALDRAVVRVNNVSRRRLSACAATLAERLAALEPAGFSSQTGIPLLETLRDESASPRNMANIGGLYTAYSLSSSTDCLKREPFMLALSADGAYIRVGRVSAYGETQWGMGANGDSQTFYCLFSEEGAAPLTLVTVYLQIPFFRHPRQLRGLYLGLDYNRNPVARRILLIKESEKADEDAFRALPFGLIAPADLTPEQQAYYDYACRMGDCIKMCTVPSLRMDASDLIREKKMLAL